MKTKRLQIDNLSSFGDEAPVPVAASKPKPLERNGRRMLPFWVPIAAHKQLRQMALDQDVTQQACLTEALNGYFKLHGKPPIA